MLHLIGKLGLFHIFKSNLLGKMKAKFKFTNVNKEYKEKPTEKVKPLNEHSNNKVTESEVFNISELKKYYVQFTENSKSNNILKYNLYYNNN